MRDLLPGCWYHVRTDAPEGAQATSCTSLEELADMLPHGEIVGPPFPELDREELPACVRVMGCLCAAHAKGRKATGPCDADEGVRP